MNILAVAAMLLAAASPAPSASPTPAPLRTSVDAFVNFIDTSASGPGVLPPEGPEFSAGSPVSPNSPYDVFSSAPITPGVAGILQLNVTERYTGSRYDASAVLGAAYVTGSMQNAMYWGENLLPVINPHLGYTALPYSIVFPTHAGQDDASASVVAPLFASVSAHDGTWMLRGGFFDLNQSDKFVFVQPPLTSVVPNIGMRTAESLADPAPALDTWPGPPPGLPLHGVDFTGHRGMASLEVTNGALPSLPGTSVHATMASLAFDHGEGTRYSFSYLHLASGGAPILTTTFFGSDPAITPGPEGNLDSSMLGGQRETIAGARAAFHVARAVDAVAEIGRAWYDADGVARPGTSKPGNFYHAGFSHTHDLSTFGLDLYRFEPRYANAILPYGVPENVWSAPWAWPGVWLKSNYQLVDNMQAPGSNRQGYRVQYAWNAKPLQVRFAYSTFHQIDPATFSNMSQAGFVEGFFLPQDDGAPTLGTEHQYDACVQWHPAFGDVTFDYADDLLHRNADPGHPEDAVTYQAPQFVATYARGIGKSVVADAGIARYAMRGSWALPFANVDYFQNAVFAGAQVAESPSVSLLVQLRHSRFNGLPTMPVGAPPNFGATTLIFEERVHG